MPPSESPPRQPSRPEHQMHRTSRTCRLRRWNCEGCLSSRSRHPSGKTCVRAQRHSMGCAGKRQHNASPTREAAPKGATQPSGQSIMRLLKLSNRNIRPGSQGHQNAYHNKPQRRPRRRLHFARRPKHKCIQPKHKCIQPPNTSVYNPTTSVYNPNTNVYTYAIT